MTRSLPPPYRRLRPPGFTLVELLITVAIIAVLIVLGFAAMGGGREQVSAARCSSNMRQLYLLSRNWGSDNSNWIPQAMWFLKDITDSKKYPPPFPGQKYSNLWKVGYTDVIGKCPASKDPSANYGINAKLVTNSNPADGGQWGHYSVYYYDHGRLRFTQLQSSQTILFAETKTISWAIGKAGAYIAGYDYLATPHKNKSHVVYMDGHVELKSANDLKAAAVWAEGIP